MKINNLKKLSIQIVRIILNDHFLFFIRFIKRIVML